MPARDDHLIEYIRDNIIGHNQAISGPYGPRRVTYADYTASGRSLRFIEEFIQEQVMPLYANTHTETSGTGLQTTRFREDARKIIHEAVGGGPDDVVIFCGSGATGAIHKLLDVMNIRLPADLNRRYDLESHIPAEDRPVVFIGPYEHHSNELPWRESIADVVTIDEDANGRVCLDHLEAALQKYQDRPLKIGSFSAASNVTGIGSKTQEISALLHRYGALSFWDFAAAGPYVQIEMNMEDPLAYKDAVFISPHKFIGGPGTPGLLIAKKHLFQNQVPAVPGGGTVSYVTAYGHKYVADPERREEGGTPDIIGSIRAGLVFQLKEEVGHEVIRAREHSFIRRAIDAWSAHPNLLILGNKDAWRLSIVSFRLRHRDRFLHHNFAVALLNDLFGIQARGGCSCAGPYGHRLLGIDRPQAEAFQDEVIRGCSGIRIGWVRMNFNYFISEAAFDYLIKSVLWIAEHGWKLLPHYTFHPDSGLWRHRDNLNPEPPMRMKYVSYRTGRMEYRSRLFTEPEWALEGYLEEADRVLEHAIARYPREEADGYRMPDHFERLRWFPLPHEVHAELERVTSESAK